MTPRHMALGAALLGAILLVAFGDRGASSDVAEPVERTAPRAPAAAQAQPVRTAPAAGGRVDQTAGAANAADNNAANNVANSAARDRRVPALVPREVLIGDGDARFGQAQGGQGDGGPFGRRDWTPPPPPPAPAPAPPPPPPPAAPPLPFTFIGKAVADGAWEVYLTRGERTYVVRDKDTIDGAYRVDAIVPPVLTLTYLPLNQVQRLNIGVFE